MRNQEVHGDVFTVYVLVHHVPDSLGHHVGVQVGVVLHQNKHQGTSQLCGYETRYIWLHGVCLMSSRSDLMEESSSGQDHGELTGVVGVVEPGLMVHVPRMVPSGETHDAVSGLAPHSVRQSQQKFSFKTTLVCGNCRVKNTVENILKG